MKLVWFSSVPRAKGSQEISENFFIRNQGLRLAGNFINHLGGFLAIPYTAKVINLLLIGTYLEFKNFPQTREMEARIVKSYNAPETRGLKSEPSHGLHHWNLLRYL